MRVSANAVRLAALVAAATASGYLWRAAFEPSQVPTIIRLAPAPELPVALTHLPPPSGPGAAPTQRPRTIVHRARRPVAHPVERTAAPAPRTYVPVVSRPATAPRPKPAPKPKPKPQPGPTPSPGTTPPQAPAGQPATSPQPVASAPAPASPSPAPPESSQPPTEATTSSKPGWGHGDKNHEHGGPPGEKHG